MPRVNFGNVLNNANPMNIAGRIGFGNPLHSITDAFGHASNMSPMTQALGMTQRHPMEQGMGMNQQMMNHPLFQKLIGQSQQNVMGQPQQQPMGQPQQNVIGQPQQQPMSQPQQFNANANPLAGYMGHQFPLQQQQQQPGGNLGAMTALQNARPINRGASMFNTAGVTPHMNLQMMQNKKQQLGNM